MMKLALEHHADAAMAALEEDDVDKEIDEAGMKLALEQAQKSYNRGGIPTGCSIVASDGSVLGAGHNERIQKSSVTPHEEISAFGNAGRLKAKVYRDATIYTNELTVHKFNFAKVVVIDDPECQDRKSHSIREKPEVKIILFGGKAMLTESKKGREETKKKREISATDHYRTDPA
ncbi:hypothetical protein GYMLUDRAFT_259563 [Collybiopsis luxurians FD-317 M1]|uniref:CMP/dCMP-type deaminase domain-containing protein n=1 Tax=Collybiopsis luxurians FD-317 M1 TaxID=944289 RepID=A0A0D0CUM9_9AGAR|nr:hypothetical protein GYMLUDRAFT_259563 [Collybiopsis luxurians FD-317 M1]